MKILFIGTANPSKQGDFLELTLIHGFRSVLGENFVEYPKKKILYGDFSESPKHLLHGRGFTFCSDPIPDVSYNRNNLRFKDFDVVIMGSGHIYGENYNIDHPNIYYTDGHDLFGSAPRMINYFGQNIIGSQFTERCFKTSLVEEFSTVYPIGFGIPFNKIRPIDFSIKNSLLCSTVPEEVFGEKRPEKYIFSDENDYYYDLARSKFALTCCKGSWNQIRHLEAIAAGTVVLYKDFDKKPLLCAPIDFPTISFSNKKECHEIMKFLYNEKPSHEYIELLQKQRAWLMRYGTTEAVALHIMSKL